MIIAGFSWRSLFPSWSTIVLDVWKYILKILSALLLVASEEAFFSVISFKSFEERVTFKICPYKSYGLYYVRDCGFLLKIPMKSSGPSSHSISSGKFGGSLAPHIITVRGWFNLGDITKKQIPPTIHCQSLREIEKYIINWYSAREWFVLKGIKHRLGILLYGPPGTGKSVFINRMKQMLNDIDDCCPVQNIIEYTKEGIVFIAGNSGLSYIEDLDRLYHGDQCVIPNGPTFDRLLSALDCAHGLIFITVNDITKLDPAIAQLTEDGRISRPGRIDRVVYVGVADEQGRRDCAAHILSEWPDLIDKVVHEGEGETIAQFSDRCKTLAVKMYWQSHVDKPTDLK